MLIFRLLGTGSVGGGLVVLFQADSIADLRFGAMACVVGLFGLVLYLAGRVDQLREEPPQ